MEKQQTMHRLTSDEVNNALFMFDELANADWCKEIIAKLSVLPKWRNIRDEECSPERDTLKVELESKATRSLLFELRWAYQMQQLGIECKYEPKSLEGSKVDFRANTPVPWFLELAVVTASGRADNAIRVEQLSPGVELRLAEFRSDTGDDTASPQYELNRLRGAILEKVGDRNGKPRKFPEPNNTYHAIVMDARGFEGGSEPDETLLRQLFYGPREMHARQESAVTLKFRGNDLRGLFDEESTEPQCALLQHRIHVVAVCGDDQIFPNKLAESTRLFVNPFLADAETAAQAFLVSCSIFRRATKREDRDH